MLATGLQDKSHPVPLKTGSFIRGLCMCWCCTALMVAALSCDRGAGRHESTDTPKTLTPDYNRANDLDILYRELSSDPQYLNPVLANDHMSLLVSVLIFDSLIDIDSSSDSNPVGRLAESWTISSDGTSITFNLKHDILWQDGTLFTADDVKFTFDMAMRPDIPSFGMKSTVEALSKVVKVDDYTIRFDFNSPFSPGFLRIGSVLIIPKHLLDDEGLAAEKDRRNLQEPVTFLTSEFNRQPVGTSAYRLAEWKSAQHIKLIRNQRYWDTKTQPSIATIMFKIIPNRTVAFNILQKGGLDVLRSSTVHYMRFTRLKSLQQYFHAETFFEPAYYFLGWNNRKENTFFSEKEIRRAMTMAIDRQSFIEKADYGLGKMITGPFYFKSWAYDPAIEPVPYDLNQAAAVLKAAGWIDSDNDGILDRKGKIFSFDMIIPSGSASFAQLASIIQAELKKLSIDVSIRIFEWSVYLERIRRGDFDAYIGGWSLGSDPDPFGIWHSSQIGVGNNYIGYSNKQVDKLIEEARRIFDRDERQQLYWQIHRLIAEDQPYSFVYTSMEKYIMSKRIHDYNISPFGLFLFYPGQLSWRLTNTESQPIAGT